MAEVVLKGIRKQIGQSAILKGIELSVADGELLVLVGPSGCGKTTLLRLVAGLEELSSGEIWIGGRRVDRLPPAERDVAMVFQSYALYPHLTVRENMAFGLLLRKVPRPEIDRRVGETAELLELEPLLERRPRQLSGGQRQRVAMGRAIVRRPQLFLFDEPLSNLDAALRQQVRLELGRLHRQLGSTMLYVTHDQVEAMTLGDRMALLRTGELMQAGPPLSLYQRPANRFVAGFLGTPSMGFLPAAVRAVPGGFHGEGEGFSLELPPSPELFPGQELWVGVRPEDLTLGALPAEARRLTGEVVAVELLGWDAHVQLRVGGSTLTARCEAARAQPLMPGAPVTLEVRTLGLRLFGRDSERALAEPPPTPTGKPAPGSSPAALGAVGL
ncbi:MAG: ABC transporter ATP-binding protein [Deltaproteobacteria bacterium]